MALRAVTEAEGEGLGAGPLHAPIILNWHMMAKQSLVSPANSVLLQQGLQTI